MRLVPAWDGCVVTYVSTKAACRDEVDATAERRGQTRPGFHVVPDVNRWSGPRRLGKAALAITSVVMRTRPDVIVTTGAMPGLFAIFAGVPLGARRIWVDSIANGNEMSLSARAVGRVTHLWLTQWPHLSDEEGGGPAYRGTVL